MGETRLRTPPLKPDADPGRAADYAARLSTARSTKEIVQIHKEFADLREQRNLRREVSSIVHAPKGSREAKARDKLGIGLVLFGIFGVTALLLVALLIGAAIFAVF